MSVEVLFPRVRKASPKERYLWQNGPKDAEAITCSNRPKDMEFPAGGEVGRCLPSYIRPSFSWSTTSIISVLVWPSLLDVAASIPSSLMGTLFTRFWSCQTFLSLGRPREFLDYFQFRNAKAR